LSELFAQFGFPGSLLGDVLEYGDRAKLPTLLVVHWVGARAHQRLGAVDSDQHVDPLRQRPGPASQQLPAAWIESYGLGWI
jgi:hypothetical protein